MAPTIDTSARIHALSRLAGDLYIGPEVRIAPGVSIDGEKGTRFYIGKGAQVQEGTIVRGLSQGRVLGDDGKDYAVWIGKGVAITHMSLIHGPCYLGDGCFVGFRSTIFNARVGHGSIIMMHVLIQDVEIPPGKYVPSGSVITTQQQADRLPDVTPADRQFTLYIADNTTAFPLIDTDPNPESFSSSTFTNRNYQEQEPTMKPGTTHDIVSQVRQLLAQGYRIGAEYADTRRFRTSSWQSCANFQSSDERSVLASLQACLAEHQGDYVRLVGIDTRSKQRVAEQIIQRPGEAVAIGNASSPVGGSVSFTPPKTNNGSSPDLTSLVRQLLSQGLRIGTEHADERRFRTSSWHSCAPIEATHEAGVMAALQTCMQEHSGEYVRLLGIDTKNKRRVTEVIIQRPHGTGVTFSAPQQSAPHYAPQSQSVSPQTDGNLATQVRHLLMQGLRIGTEHADERRFRTSSWHSCAPIEATHEAGVMTALQACLQEHSGEYVRLFGIDPKNKRRVSEQIIQRPSGKALVKPSSSTPSSSPSPSYAPTPTNLPPETANHIRQLLLQGNRVSAEYADERRFRTSSWHSCSPIEGTTEAMVLVALERILSDHPREYVRLIGMDPRSKRRVLETIVQRPKK